MELQSSKMEIQSRKSSVSLEMESDSSDAVSVETLNWDTTAKSVLEKFQNIVEKFFKTNKRIIIRVLQSILLVGYFVFFGFALSHNFTATIPLLVITSLVISWILYLNFKKYCGGKFLQVIQPFIRRLRKSWAYLQWLTKPAIAILVIVYLASIITDTKQIVAICGLVFFMSIPLITCKHPSKIKWRPVVWGMGIQFVLGIMVLRWRPGYLAVNYLSKQINKLLFYCMRGASVVFGDPFFLFHPFLMLIVPLMIYVGAVTGLMHHFGVIRWIVKKVGFWMRLTMGTTGIESVSLALNIFFSVAESVLILRPYIRKLTKSEFHTLLCGSHATIAGWAYAIFVLFGVDPRHLLTAAVMSAPAAVAIAKLNYPETEESVFKHEDDCDVDTGSASNAMDAITTGAVEAAKTVMTLLVQIIAFLSMYEFIEVTIGWLGSLVGLELNLSIIFSYVFMWLCPLLGVSWEESQTVAPIIGLKLTANEILAYLELGKMRAAQVVTERTSALVTYAICGLSSFGTLAMFIGVWTTVDSNRVNLVYSLIPRIFMNTNLACFVTACVAAILYDETITGTDVEKSLINLPAVVSLLPSYKQLFPLIGWEL